MSPILGHAPGLPDDAPRAIAAVLACAALVALPRLLRGMKRVPRGFGVAAALAAAALSAGYVVHYLRGGPRIIDATAYYLEARTLAHGSFAFALPEPDVSLLGRFLVRTPGGEAAVIFPPGYPAVLALAVLAGAPMALGPILAAALVLATMALARALAGRVGAQNIPLVVTTAALLSVFSGTLRYHTADTMAHGLAALCVTIVAWLALRGGNVAACGLGAAWGLLFATRPATALAVAAALVVAAALARPRLRSVALAIGCSLPPLLLWAAYQHAATGSVWHTAQGLYYDLADGPPGCFRYGFGAGIGCRGEHGAFVAANLGDGYGLVAALKTTGRRLQLHLSDAVGFAPAFLVVPLGALRVWREPRARALVLVVPALWLAYAPFYFDGNYPGGGARMFADALPIEHVLAALALEWAARERREVWAAVLVALGFFGFAFHHGGQHRQLAEREGGRPMFEPQRVDAPLVFVDTNHGFDLAFNPAHPERVARWRGDDLDRLAWEARGRPRAVRYHHDWGDGVRVEPLALTPPGDDALHVEGESLWPPLAQASGWAWPSHVGTPCASRGKVLWLEARTSVALRLPAAAAGRSLWLVMLDALGGEAQVHVAGASVARAPLGEVAGCTRVGPLPIPEAAPDLRLVVTCAGECGLDALELRKNH